MMSLLIALLSVALAVCPAELGDLQIEMDAANTAIIVEDADLFQAVRDEAQQSMTCLSHPVTPILAAAYHRLMGLDAFVWKKEDEATLHYRAAIELQPEYALAEDIAPQGHPLRGLYAMAAFEEPSARTKVRPPAYMRVFVDGRITSERPTDIPSILQLVTPQGIVQETVHLMPDTEAPSWALSEEWAAEETPEVQLDRLPTEMIELAPIAERKGTRVPLLVAAGGAVVTGAALFGAGLSTRGSYRDLQTPSSEIDSLRERANTLGYAGQITAGLGLGVGIVAVVVKR